MKRNLLHKLTENRRAVLTAAVGLSFVCGLFIPSPLFYFTERLGGRRVFLARDTTEMIMPDGSVYEGTVNAFNGKFNGYGVLKTAHTSYIGKWKNGRFVFGKVTDGQMSYEGTLNEQLDLDGFGIVHYNPEYIDSLRSAGVPDSTIITTYIGNWSKNIRNGLGRAVMADSTMVFGQFENGDLVKMQGADFRSGETVYGIDLSHFQRNLDWDNFALFCDSEGKIFYDTPADETYLQPVFFVYIKATEGVSYKDAAFFRHMTEARRHGIARGAYHFLRLNGSAEDQITNFTETAKWRQGDLPPVLDVELESEILSYGVDNFLDFTYKWLKGVEEKTGVKPMIYTTDKIRNLYLKQDSRFEEFDYWMARYNHKMPVNTDWKFWQFSDKGRLNGYASPVDLDVYNDDFASFNHYLKTLSRNND